MSDMSDKKRSIIMLYGLTADEIDFIMKELPECDFRYAGCCTDMIAIYADLVIADLSDADDDEIAMLADYYKQVEPSQERLVLVKKIEALRGIKNIEQEEGIFEKINGIKTVALRCLHETARDVDFSRRLVLALSVMRIIYNNPGISTKKLVEMLELSERSVKRYIDTLRMAGAIIEYRNKGWSCPFALWDY